MCGIAGIADFSGASVERSVLEIMCDAIRHRGPDHRGIVIRTDSSLSGSACVGLANQRLSIIDLASGDQPIANEDETVWTVLNGELYNFQSLRQQLEARGHRFRTASDTEVIVHLYEEKGDTFVQDLDGMFALAVWDARRQRLILARDRFGKKPLLYANDGGRIRFASEFLALLAPGDLCRDVDLEALDAYLAFMSVPAPLTVYRAIRKLPPASLLVRDQEGTRISRYWSLEYLPKYRIDERDAAVQVRQLLTDAVRKRMTADVPLGAFLSGGIDSSAVVAIMAGISKSPVKTFSIGFEDADYNELPYARRVSDRFHTDHHEFVVRARATDVLPTLIRHYGEPYADSSAVPSFYLARLAREHVTVALNGDGSDEAFAGYPWHQGNRVAELWSAVPNVARRLVEAGISVLPRQSERHAFASRVHRFVHAARKDRAARYGGWTAGFDALARSALVNASWRADYADRALRGVFERFGAYGAVDAYLAADTELYLPNDLLVKMDIATMANSLEARSPFLDHRLVEFVARLPSDFKLRGRTSKYVLRRAVADLVPAENLSRAKRGFAVPLDRWFRSDLRELASDYLLDRTARERGLLDAAYVRKLWDDHQAGRSNCGHELWVLLILEMWLREFIDHR